MRRIVESIALAFLALTVTPLAIRRSLIGVNSKGEAVIAFAVGVAVAGLILLVLAHIEKVTPKTSDHALVSRYVSPGLALIVAAAKLVGAVLGVVIAVSLALNSLRSAIGAEPPAWVGGLVIVVLAIPVLLGIRPHPRFLGAIVGTGFVLSFLILVAGVIVEAVTTTTWVDAVGNSVERAVAELRYGQSVPLLGAIVGACLPIACLGLMVERHFSEGTSARVSTTSLLKLFGPTLVGIGLTLYLTNTLAVSTQFFGAPVQAFAHILVGRTGSVAIAVVMIVTTLAIAIALFDRMPGYLRLLGASGVLPRRLAAADDRAPRQIIIAGIVIVCATFTGYLQSLLGISHMFVVVMALPFLVTMVGLVARGRRTRADSTIPVTRKRAVHSIVLGYVTGAVLLAVIIFAVVSNPLVAAGSVLALTVPTALLIRLRRERGQIRESITAEDLSEGRTLPTRVHGLVIVDSLNLANIQAITYARATRPSSLAAIVVDVNPEVTEALQRDWQEADLPVELRILGTPRGAARRPIIDHIRRLRHNHPRDIFVVFYARIVTPQASWRRLGVAPLTGSLIHELRQEPGVMVTEVPYQIIEDVE